MNTTVLHSGEKFCNSTMYCWFVSKQNCTGKKFARMKIKFVNFTNLFSHLTFYIYGSVGWYFQI